MVSEGTADETTKRAGTAGVAGGTAGASGPVGAAETREPANGARKSRESAVGAAVAAGADSAGTEHGSGAAGDSDAGDRVGDATATAATDPKIAAAVAAAEAAGAAPGESVRIDSWIWSVRLAKTRSQGATACRGGHVRVNGERVKPAYSVRIGDEVRVRQEGWERVVVVTRLIRKRVGAPVAAQCYIDNSPPPPPREAVAPIGIRDRGAGRPTKRDRRDMERLRGAPGFGTLGGPPSPVGPAGLGSSGGSRRGTAQPDSERDAASRSGEGRRGTGRPDEGRRGDDRRGGGRRGRRADG